MRRPRLATATVVLRPRNCLVKVFLGASPDERPTMTPLKKMESQEVPGDFSFSLLTVR